MSVNQAMIENVVTRERVIELAQRMPSEKLLRWYEYGLFIQASSLTTTATEAVDEDEAKLWQEFADWEAASDEDWLKMEDNLGELLEVTGCVGEGARF
ncbi:MAG: hypothetical protein KF753_04125 [Caldilineaceae bacterium]|nr:hypothetical protein [Caldilineaceae bacterium]